ncbi:retrotransposon protein, putative, ty1-copia subclass, partial [Tanacetum coccineum]
MVIGIRPAIFFEALTHETWVARSSGGSTCPARGTGTTCIGCSKKGNLSSTESTIRRLRYQLIKLVEDKLSFLEQQIPAMSVPLVGQVLRLNVLATHAAWVKSYKEIAGLMLMTMEPEIHKNLEQLGAYEMLKELKTLFSQQAEHELLQTVREFHACKQEEGQSVSSYVLKIKSYIDILESLSHSMSLNLAVSLILISLSKEYNSFVQNYNMHGMGKTMNELHAMLKLHEQTLPKKDVAPGLYAIRADRVQKKNHKNKKPQLAARENNQGKGKTKLAYDLKPKIPPPPKKDNPAKDVICHQCGDVGHWRRNCPRKSCFYDTGYDTHICNTTQGLKGSKKMKPRALNLNKRAKLNLDSTLVWHCLLGHISKKRIEKLQHDRLLNSNDIESFDKCISCLSGKMARKPYSHQVERANDLLGLIHTDVCGPFRNVSRQGASYFITFTDDFGHYGYVYLLKNKHEVFETFKVFQKEVENQLGKTIKLLRYDCKGEYMSQEFLDHLKEYGIIIHHTPPYTPQHNGVSERKNRTLLDMVCSMMSQTTLPKSFSNCALESAASILNMVPTKKVEKTPYKVWHGQAHKLSYLKVWGCEALVKRVTLTKPDKLEPRFVKSIFVGCPKETTGYSFYYPHENKILVARNAELFENSLITQEASGSVEDLEIIQDEDTLPSENTSLHHDEEDQETDEPQSDIIPVCRSIRTRHALDLMCLYIDVEEHELGDLNE